MADAPDMTDHELIRNFESLGGTGHGAEFGRFQTGHGVQALGLLGWADLAPNLLAQALEERFAGVGEPTNTIIFRPHNHEEWWTRDTRYWMAMRSLVKVASPEPNREAPAILERLRTLRDALIADLEAGRKLFVFRDSINDVDDARAERLRAAIRTYGPAILFLLRYETPDHPAGTVEAVKPGLLIGYVSHFTVDRQQRFIGPIDEALLALCRRAWSLHTEATAAPPASAPRRSARRHIVFVGNRQIEAMVSLYRRYVMPRTRDHVEYVPSYETLGGERRSALDQADLIVEQVMDLSPQTETGSLAADTPRIQVPLVTGAFLWPFRAQAHPKGRSYPFMEAGAFDTETSDSYLNRLVLSGIDPEEAADAYINLNVAETVNLDRLYELMIDRQRARDTVTGYDIAGIIESRFRTEYLFLTPYHPNLRVSLALADELFRRLGADADDIDRMHARTLISPFPAGETPIHPAVARHWGLQYIAPDQRYRYRNEGAFTFREYALRYLRYEWNAALEEGLWLSDQRRYADAVAPLRAGVAASPQSARGFCALGEALMRTGEAEAALADLRRAVAIEPSNGSHHAALGGALREAGRIAEAADALRAAASADPTEPHYEILLAQTLRSEGKAAQAAEAYERALALDPWSEQTWQELAIVREESGDIEGARQALRRALEIDDTDSKLQAHLARLKGEGAAAAPAPPAAPQGQPTTLTEAFAAAVIAPDDAGAYSRLGGLLCDAGDWVAAEQAFRRAVHCAPDNAHHHHQLSALLLSLDRHQDAITLAEQAIEREPVNPHRYGYLANLLARVGSFDRARAALSVALTILPGHVPFRVTTSDLFAREGRLEEALDTAQAIVRDAPSNALGLGHLAHVEQMMGRMRDAETHLRAAIALDPDSAHLRRQMDRLLQQAEAV